MIRRIIYPEHGKGAMVFKIVFSLASWKRQWWLVMWRSSC